MKVIYRQRCAWVCKECGRSQEYLAEDILMYQIPRCWCHREMRQLTYCAWTEEGTRATLFGIPMPWRRWERT